LPVIVASGDSNTRGCTPGRDARVAPDARWGARARALGSDD